RGTLIAVAGVTQRRRTRGGRNPQATQRGRTHDVQQATDAVVRDAGGLEAERVGREERLEIVGPTPQLIRRVVKRLVEHDRTGYDATQRQVAVFLTQLTRRGIGPLHAGVVEVEAHRARHEVAARATTDAQLCAAESAARYVIRRRDERRGHRGVTRQVAATEAHAV